MPFPIPGPGRKVEYTEEVAAEILTWIASGKSLLSWCESHPGGPGRETIYHWLRRPEPEFAAFRHNMRLAREDQADSWFDEGQKIIDESVAITEKGGMDMAAVQDKRLRFEGRLKLAALSQPKKYTPTLKNEHTGKDGGPVVVASAQKEMSDAELDAFIAAERVKADAAAGGHGTAAAPEGAAKP